MRRRLEKFLPIVMLAILVQLLAPIGATFAMSAALDPLASIPICASADGDHAGQSQPNGDQPNHQTCCLLCVVAQGSALADVPDAATATPLRIAQGVVWLEHPTDAAPARHASHAQARAPPAHS